MNSISAAQQGRALYHAIWQTVGARFFDVTRLANWGFWEHRFDGLIVDESSALRHCDHMLASLNDPFTKRLIPDVVPEEGPSTGAFASGKDRPANVTSWLSPSNIGYLRILNFDHEEITAEVETAADVIAGCDGLLLDLRPNRGGLLHRAIECAGLFLQEGLVTTVESRLEGGGVLRSQYFLNPDDLFCVKSLPDGSEKTLRLPDYRRRPALLSGKPMVVLIHRRSCSSAEMFAAAVVQNGLIGKVLTVGGITAGKGIGQIDVEFEVTGGRVIIRITSSRWLCPGGEWLGDCGQTRSDPIRPNIVVTDDLGPQGLKVADHQLRIMLGRIIEPSCNR
jgi:hypothetical protein